MKSQQKLFKGVRKLILFFLLLGVSSLLVADADSVLRGEIYYGYASWYGGKFHGRKTSSGERYNKHKLTAAHNLFPFNTLVRVTNTRNNKSVVVRINDRGPFSKDRIIDLSEKAAHKLDGKTQGIIHVRLQVLKDDFQGKKIADKRLT